MEDIHCYLDEDLCLSYHNQIKRIKSMEHGQTSNKSLKQEIIVQIGLSDDSNGKAIMHEYSW
jgi:hypothetical protein